MKCFDECNKPGYLTLPLPMRDAKQLRITSIPNEEGNRAVSRGQSMHGGDVFSRTWRWIFQHHGERHCLSVRVSGPWTDALTVWRLWLRITAHVFQVLHSRRRCKSNYGIRSRHQKGTVKHPVAHGMLDTEDYSDFICGFRVVLVIHGLYYDSLLLKFNWECQPFL